VVECDLAKVEVAGSNPVSRSKSLKVLRARAFPNFQSSLLTVRSGGWTFFLHVASLRPRARYPSGKGEVCKTFIREFDSHPRLQLLYLACTHCVKCKSSPRARSTSRRQNKLDLTRTADTGADRIFARKLTSPPA
jgi:hypothetical protein